MGPLHQGDLVRRDLLTRCQLGGGSSGGGRLYPSHHRPGEAVRVILEASPETSVVVYTAYRDPVTEREMRATGASMFVVKGDRRIGITSAIAAAAGACRPAGTGSSGHPESAEAQPPR